MVVRSRRWRVSETRRTNLVTSGSKDYHGALKPSEYVERGQICVSCEEADSSLIDKERGQLRLRNRERSEESGFLVVPTPQNDKVGSILLAATNMEALL